jgi:hypothetical protein
MSLERERKYLADTERHIAETKNHIARQRVIIQNAIDKGQPSLEAEDMLAALENSLRIFERRRQQMLDELAAKGSP